MRTGWQIVLLVAALECMLFSMAFAQEQTLTTDPPETYLSIKGPVSLSGSAPFPLSGLPHGEYSLQAQGPGLAAARGRFRLDESGLRFRSWAGPSAMVQPPGLTHLLRGEGRGWYYLGGATLSGLLWWSNDNSADDAPDASAKQVDERRVRNLWAGYFAAAWLSAGVESWLFTPQPRLTSLRTGQYMATFPRAGRWKAAFRSSLAPGAGQRSMGRNRRATVFSTLVAASAAGAILAQDSFLDTRRDVAAARRRVDQAPPGDALRLARAELDDATSDRDTRSLVRWILVGTTAYFYLWNVVDAYLVGRRGEAAGGPSVSLAPSPTGVAVSMSWRFP